jgi:DNA-binding NtrC family response regulator
MPFFPRLEHTLHDYLGVILRFSELLLRDAAADDPRRVDYGEIHKAALEAARLVSAATAARLVASAVEKPAGDPAQEGLEALERNHIARVLADEGGNKAAAARRLGISRRTLYRRLARHRLDDPGGAARS